MLLMQYLNNYTLQCSANSNVKKHNLLANIAPLCKLIAIVSLVGLFWSLFTLIAFALFWTLSIVLTSYKNKLIFTYKYSINDGNLVVYKEDLLFKKQILANIGLSSITSCTIEEDSCAKQYYDKNFDNGFVIKITTNDDTFAIISDEYMYSVLNFHLVKDKI